LLGKRPSSLPQVQVNNLIEEVKGPSAEELASEQVTINSQMDEGVPSGWKQKWELSMDDSEVEQAITAFFSVAEKYDA
jgi:hypothetical protein